VIVCKRCGNHNPAGDDFCGSCGAFLEWEGERIVEEVAEQPAALPPPTGLVTKIKHAVLGDGPALPPPVDAGQTPLASPSPGSAAPTVALQPPSADAKSGAASAASALVARSPAAAQPTAARQPSAQAPAAAVARPKPQVMQAPTRTINPGDLVCGSCGEANAPDRNFCRRCGASLAELVPVKQRWWKRRSGAAKTSKATAAKAGERPMVAGGKDADTSRGGAKKGARKVKGGIFGGFNSVRRVLALLAIVGIGTGMAVPGLRSTIMNKGGDIFKSVKNKINPSFTQVSPDDILSIASSAAPGHEATMIADGASNTYWIAAPDATEGSATVTFAPPTKLAKILITPGDQEKKEDFKAQPRPKDLFVEALDAGGATLKTAQITLDDKADPQKFSLSASNVVAVRVTVQSCYPDPALRVCGITELEFFKQK
jgi:hypothetical protein